MGQLPRRILLVRTDRIGDWLLTTPSLEALHQAYPDSELSLLVNPVVKPLVEKCPYVRNIHTYSREMGSQEKAALVAQLREAQYDAAIVFFIDRAVLSVLRQSKIPRRIGPSSKLQSFLHLNERIEQRRSLSTKSEAIYNLELLQVLGLEKIPTSTPTRIWTDEVDERHAVDYLERNGIGPNDRFVLIHPGSGGSSLNWPLTRYRKLITALARIPGGPKIALSAGRGEEHIVQGLIIDLAGPLHRFFEIPNLRVFARILHKASLVIGGSTGPTHMANAMGTPILGFYSPMMTQSPLRWGPFPEHRVQAVPTPLPYSKPIIFVPDVECPVKTDCLHHHCPHAVEGRDCMGRILVEDVLAQVQLILKNQPSVHQSFEGDQPRLGPF